MRIAILSAALIVAVVAPPAHAQRGGRMGAGHGGWEGGFGRWGDRGFDRWGYGFDRWGWGFGPYAWWGLYGYPFAPYSAFYYSPSMYYVPPTYSTMVQPVVTYYPVPVPVAVSPPTPPAPYSGYVGGPVSPPPARPNFNTYATPQPVYPGFTPSPSTSSSGYYPDAP